MYGAMREHAPSSTRITGVVSTTALTLALGFALANGLGIHVVRSLPDPIIYVPLAEEAPPEASPTENKLDVTSDTRLPVVDPLYEPTVFEAEPTRITGTVDTGPRANPGPSLPLPPIPPRPPVRTAAKMLPAASPAYPAADIRRGNEGVTSLAVCLDAAGRVTSASLAGSSGHDSLDRAALRWVRDLKFTPAKVDGTPQPVCGHSVVYEWTLDRR